VVLFVAWLSQISWHMIFWLVSSPSNGKDIVFDRKDGVHDDGGDDVEWGTLA
jgi:hypothetical protein